MLGSAFRSVALILTTLPSAHPDLAQNQLARAENSQLSLISRMEFYELALEYEPTGDLAANAGLGLTDITELAYRQNWACLKPLPKTELLWMLRWAISQPEASAGDLQGKIVSRATAISHKLNLASLIIPVPTNVDPAQPDLRELAERLVHRCHQAPPPPNGTVTAWQMGQVRSENDTDALSAMKSLLRSKESLSPAMRAELVESACSEFRNRPAYQTEVPCVRLETSWPDLAVEPGVPSSLEVLLTSPDVNVRWASAFFLARSHRLRQESQMALVKDFVKLANQSDPGAEKALLIFGGFDGRQIRPILTQAIFPVLHTTGERLAVLLRALARLEGGGAMQVRQMASDSSLPQEAKGWAVRALIDRGDVSDLPFLIEVARSGKFSLQMASELIERPKWAMAAVLKPILERGAGDAVYQAMIALRQMADF